MGAFKAYDIRGVYGEELNEEMAYRIGFFLPDLLKTREILVGHDARLSSGPLTAALIQGITDSGNDVLFAGLCSTPMIYYGSGRFQVQGSVQVTASHNPPEYNGMKVSGAWAMPVGYDNGLGQLEQQIKHAPVPGHVRGQVRSIDLKSPYLTFLKGFAPAEMMVDLVIDASHGMAGLLVRQVFGDRCIYLNETPDGRFPAHEPNPLDPASRKQLEATVRNKNAKLGMIFDGDGDRVMFVDENGAFIPPDLMIAVLGHHFLEDLSPQTVLQDIRTSRSVAAYLSQWHAKVVTWRVGRAYAAPRLREIKGLYGGELAGHYYFSDFYYSDSGLLAALLISRVFSRFMAGGTPPSVLMEHIRTYHSSGEMNYKIQDKQSAIQAFIAELPEKEVPVSIMDFDGYRLDFRDWWFNVRPSNTEPYLRFIVEAISTDLLEQKRGLADRIAASFID